MKRRFLFFFLVLVAVFVIAGCSSKSGNDVSTGQAMTIFKSSNCGCCGIYSNYAENKGFAVSIENLPEVETIKAKYNVPQQLASCHTSVVREYFVEGHIPAEAVEKLLAEKPDIAGIALPGMPSGSPGMPGPKQQEWVIYAVHHDGSISEFMRM